LALFFSQKLTFKNNRQRDAERKNLLSYHVQALLYHFILTMMKQGMVSEGAVLETASGYVNLGGGGLSIEGIPVNL
jgi:hypothetical protein